MLYGHEESVGISMAFVPIPTTHAVPVAGPGAGAAEHAAATAAKDQTPNGELVPAQFAMKAVTCADVPLY